MPNETAELSSDLIDRAIGMDQERQANILLLLNDARTRYGLDGSQDVIPHLKMVDELRNTKNKVLSDGFVRFVDYFGSDARIAEAARLTSKSDPDAPIDGLIRYLMRHRHSTPVEFGEIVLHLRVPMDLWRQWIRHRTATVNEHSTRYSPAIDAVEVTDADKWRRQSTANRQGSSGEFVTEWPKGYALILLDKNGDILTGSAISHESTQGWAVVYHPVEGDASFQVMAKYPTLTRAQITPGLYLSDREKLVIGQSRSIYAERSLFDVAGEQSRKDLTLSSYTEAYWKIDLHNLLHFLSLRMDAHAQLEIRECANVIGGIIAKLFPIVYQAFLDFRLNMMQLTALDIMTIKRLQSGERVLPGDGRTVPPFNKLTFYAAIPEAWAAMRRSRERDECEAKLRALGLLMPADTWEL